MSARPRLVAYIKVDIGRSVAGRTTVIIEPNVSKSVRVLILLTK